MTTTAETPATGEESGADAAGLTIDDHSVILAALGMVLEVTQAAAGRILQAERPAAEREVTQAEERASEARTAALPGQQAVAHLEGELAGCEQKAAELQAARDDEDLAVRLNARALKVAVEQETEALRARLQEAARANDPLNDVCRQAEHDLKRAQAHLADLNAAIELPFAHPRGQATEAHRVYSLRTGLWSESDGPTARAIVDAYLRRTKYGEQIERRAIAAYLDGDPATRSAGGVKTFTDGRALINTGDVPIVVNGRAAPGDLAGVPPVPTTAPSGADIMSGMRNAAGQMPSPATVTKTANIEQEWQLPSAIRRAYGG